MKHVAFTLCSNNFLAYAASWADSMSAHNPEYQIVIGIVDKQLTADDYRNLKQYTIVNVEDVGVPNLSWMKQNYNLVEINTAVKPFYFAYLFGVYRAETILFFDPDIYVLSSIEPVSRELVSNDVVLTPHVNNPIAKGTYPWENHFLKHGLYNLGFIGLKNTNNVQNLLSWWKERLAEHCLADSANGLYVDQLWANFIPLFFSKVFISRHPGANVAFWNLHEREVVAKGDKLFVNDSPLVFFHFSSFNPENPCILAKAGYSNFDYGRSAAVSALMRTYAAALLHNDHRRYTRIGFGYESAYFSAING
jgi:hypothetical protein